MAKVKKVVEIPAVGSRWQDNDKRSTRTVTVVHGFDEVGKRVRIRNEKTARITWASIWRFGRSNGYTRLEA